MEDFRSSQSTTYLWVQFLVGLDTIDAFRVDRSFSFGLSLIETLFVSPTADGELVYKPDPPNLSPPHTFLVHWTNKTLNITLTCWIVSMISSSTHPATTWT